MDINNITEEEIKIITNKVKNDEASPEEELALLQFLNKGVEEMRQFVKEITKEEEIEKIKNSI